MKKILLIILISLLSCQITHADDEEECQNKKQSCDGIDAEFWQQLGINTFTPGGGIIGSSVTGAAHSALSICCDESEKDKITVYYDGAAGLVQDKHTILYSSITSEPAYFWLKALRIKVEKVADKVCYSYRTLFHYNHLGCKFLTPEKFKPSDQPVGCNVADSCFNSIKKNSKQGFNFAAFAVQCVDDTLKKVFFQKCQNHISGQNSLFYNFKTLMRDAVMILLALYVTIFGFKILLGQEQAIRKGEIMTAIFKIILVTYFAVGLVQPDGTYRDGITDYAYPTLKAASNSFSTYVLKGGNSNGLCAHFSGEDYAQGRGNLALWDTLDCKIRHYLTLPILFNEAELERIAGRDNGNRSAVNVFFYVGMMFKILVTGHFLLALLFIMIFIFILSAAVFFVHHFLLCLITLSFTMFLAPLFVPMALFQQTKRYFESWLNLAVSYALQPVIVTAFLALMLTVYDKAILGGCEFDYNQDDEYYYVTNLNDSSCKSSIGYYLGRASDDKGSFQGYGMNSDGSFSETFVESLKMAFLFSFLFYYFGTMVANFAADVTGGASVGGLGADPNLISNKAGSALGSAVDAGIGKKRSSGSSGDGNEPPPPAADNDGGSGGSGGTTPRDGGSGGGSGGISQASKGSGGK